jgi:uncharacterized membrane protein YraQ (UPF0718 family)
LKRPTFDWALALVAALSIGAAIYVYIRFGSATFVQILWDDILLLATILPKVVAGCLIGALVRILVPRDVIVRLVGEGSGLRGLLIATGAGAIFPGGPFTIFPLAGVFLISGADRGAAIAFVSSWLLIGINRVIIWELPFFGTDFILDRVAVSLLMPIAIGYLARVADRFLLAKAP